MRYTDSPQLRLLARRVSESLRRLRSWETLLDQDPLAWASYHADPSLVLNSALQSPAVLQECRRWLESHGWH